MEEQLIRVAIADDQELIRNSLKIIIGNTADMEVVCVAENGAELLEAIEYNLPDVVLLDIRMPKVNGVECTRIINERHPKTKIIILTAFEDDEYLFNAIKYGANGYLLKGVTTKELTDSIRMVYNEGAPVNPGVAAKLFNYFSQMARGELHITMDADKMPTFSKNELAIIQYIGQGLSNKEIAEKMMLSEGTCRNYTSEILDKTNLRDRTQIAIFAMQSGLLYRLLEEEDSDY